MLVDGSGSTSSSVQDAFASSRLALLKQAGVDLSPVALADGETPAAEWRQVSAALMPGLHAQALAAGYSHVLDYLQAGAKAGQLPAAGARTAGSYENPSSRRADELQALEKGGLSEQAARAKVHSQALAYAARQLARYRQLAAKTGDSELSKLLAGNGDPLDLYSQASQRVTKLAGKAGYSDPRVYLHDLVGAPPAPPPASASVNAGNSPAHTGAH